MHLYPLRTSTLLKYVIVKIRYSIYIYMYIHSKQIRCRCFFFYLHRSGKIFLSEPLIGVFLVTRQSLKEHKLI